MTAKPSPQKTIIRANDNFWGKLCSLSIKLLAVVLLILLCCILSGGVLRWKICKGPDRTILFWLICKKEQEALFWETCKESDLNLPPNTEVLVSACTRPSATGVPGGEVLFVREGLTDKTYLLDLRTGEKRDVPDDPLLLDHGVFLSSELVWLQGSNFSQPESPGYMPHYILDLTDGRRYEMLNLNLLPRLERGKFDTKYYSYFPSAEQVFIHHSKYTLIALSSGFRQHPERNVVFSETPTQTPSGNFENGKVLEQLMKDLRVNYEVVDLSLRYADIPSPTGRYIVRDDGIYFSETNTLVVSREWYFIGWYFDESGVITHKDPTYPYYDPGGSAIGTPVYYPILKLRLPKP